MGARFPEGPFDPFPLELLSPEAASRSSDLLSVGRRNPPSTVMTGHKQELNRPLFLKLELEMKLLFLRHSSLRICVH